MAGERRCTAQLKYCVWCGRQRQVSLTLLYTLHPSLYQVVKKRTSFDMLAIFFLPIRFLLKWVINTQGRYKGVSHGLPPRKKKNTLFSLKNQNLTIDLGAPL